MKILIDISHPAHIHLFKNFAKIMTSKGHNLFFTAREKDVTIDLLKHYDFNYLSFGKNYKTILSKIIGILKFEILLFKVSLKFRPDIYISHGSFYSAIIAFITRKPSIVLHNTDVDFLIKYYKSIV